MLARAATVSCGSASKKGKISVMFAERRCGQAAVEKGWEWVKLFDGEAVRRDDRCRQVEDAGKQT